MAYKKVDMTLNHHYADKNLGRYEYTSQLRRTKIDHCKFLHVSAITINSLIGTILDDTCLVNSKLSANKRNIMSKPKDNMRRISCLTLNATVIYRYITGTYWHSLYIETIYLSGQRFKTL